MESSYKNIARTNETCNSRCTAFTIMLILTQLSMVINEQSFPLAEQVVSIEEVIIRGKTSYLHAHSSPTPHYPDLIHPSPAPLPFGYRKMIYQAWRIPGIHPQIVKTMLRQNSALQQHRPKTARGGSMNAKTARQEPPWDFDEYL